MEDMVEKGLNSFLSCVETGTDGQIMHITVLGRIASYYYLTYTTVRNFSETLKASMPVEEVVQVLVDDTEEVPVWHNKDNLNTELAAQGESPHDGLPTHQDQRDAAAAEPPVPALHRFPQHPLPPSSTRPSIPSPY